MDLFGGTREDTYAFTHAVMYTAFFGIDPVPHPRSRELILKEAEAALAQALDSEDYDVGGELLLAWPLTGTGWHPAAVFGFKVLADVEDQVGYLPAAATRLERLNALCGETRAEYLTATAYHTAYVMGLLCAAALATDHEPPRSIPLGASVPGAAAAILPFLSDGSRRRHWQDTFDRLSIAERDAVSELLITVGLHRRVAAHDYEGAARLLEVATSQGMAATPAASQAAELINRLALFMGNRVVAIAASSD